MEDKWIHFGLSGPWNIFLNLCVVRDEEGNPLREERNMPLSREEYQEKRRKGIPLTNQEVAEKMGTGSREHVAGKLEEILDNPLQLAQVLQWFADKIWVADVESEEYPDYHSKSYDPLLIELNTDGGGTAHSYVFNFRDGGRHHPFDSLNQLEEWLVEELVRIVRGTRELI